MAWAIVQQIDTTQSIPNNTVTKVDDFGQVDASAGGVWNNGAQAFVCPTDGAGWHNVWASGVEWQGEQQGAHLVEARVVRVGGATERYTLDQSDGDWSVTATTGLVHGGFVAVDLEVGDKVECWVRQISGATQTLAKVRQFGVRAW